LPGLAGREFAKQIRCARWAAQGIAAESPQDLHQQIRGLGAESPVAAWAAMRPFFKNVVFPS
jgi:hypothetical protein